ncbi:hypothetical protein A1OW_21995 [Enterovibrio norvegicus]|uniref:hypothetical protein n=1 Tax=Enterovibrio norvegicus TaxID=188144 RepID=UPI0002D83127|nr:hypothetical protein [Enterovibrio norvegicus]OEF57243.1 hypothetical protein A1OW_21995 [Enterovibrio norvegicus]
MRQFIFIISLLIFSPLIHAGIVVKTGLTANSSLINVNEKVITTVIDFDGDPTKLPGKPREFPIEFQAKEVIRNVYQVGTMENGVMPFNAQVEMHEKSLNVDGKFERQKMTESESVLGLVFSGDVDDQGKISVTKVKSRTAKPQFDEFLKQVLEKAFNELPYFNHEFEPNKPVETVFAFSLPIYQGLQVSFDITATYVLVKQEQGIAYISENSLGNTTLKTESLDIKASYQSEGMIEYDVDTALLKRYYTLTEMAFSHPLIDGTFSKGIKMHLTTMNMRDPLKAE